MELVRNAETQTSSRHDDEYVTVGRCWRHGAVLVTEGSFYASTGCPICGTPIIPLLYQKVVPKAS